jgi:hypothetical protein
MGLRRSVHVSTAGTAEVRGYARRILAEHATNTRRINQLESIIQRLLDRVLCREYHGSVTIDILIRDGTIQEIEEPRGWPPNAEALA